MENILSQFNTSMNGLSRSKVLKRQKEYGLNKIEEKKPTPLIKLFLIQFVDILIGLLLVAAVAAYAIGDVIDAGVILLAVLLNVIMGFIQEYRSQKAVESLKNLIVKTAVVKREGAIEQVNSEELTIGDIVILEKEIEDEVYMDSNILSGNAIGVVKAVGMKTEIGAIAKIVQEDDEDTPLKTKVGNLGKILSLIAIIVCIAIFILELFKGIPLVETFMTAVSLAVAAIPEGLPAVLTLTLALGMQEMAKSKNDTEK